MSEKNFETEAIRNQMERSRFQEHSTPLYLTSSFVFEDAEEMRASFSEENDRNIYSRFSNPNTTEFTEQAIFDELQAKNTGILYEEEGAEYPFEHNLVPSVLGTLLSPLAVAGEIITFLTYPKMEWWGLLSWIGWLHLIFAGFEIKRAILKKRQLKK